MNFLETAENHTDKSQMSKVSEKRHGIYVVCWQRIALTALQNMVKFEIPMTNSFWELMWKYRWMTGTLTHTPLVPALPWRVEAETVHKILLSLSTSLVNQLVTQSLNIPGQPTGHSVSQHSWSTNWSLSLSTFPVNQLVTQQGAHSIW